MGWNLFIDDERNLGEVTWVPAQVLEKYNNEDWVICRNHYEVFDEILQRGMPMFVSFDHDLGNDSRDGYWIVKEMVDIDMKTIYSMYMFPADFDFHVHSQNPIGKQNIEGYLNGYLKACARALEVPFNTERFEEIFDIAKTDEDGDIRVGKLKI